MCKKINEYITLKHKKIIIFLCDRKIIPNFAISEFTIYPHFNNSNSTQ